MFRKYFFRAGLVTTTLLTSSFWFPQPTAHALSFVVDSVADVPDVNIGDGVCSAGRAGCTLRAAIQESNAATRDNFDQISFSLPLGDNVIELTSALPVLTRTDRSVRIGNTTSGDMVEISGNGTIPGLVSQNRVLTLENLSLTGFTTAVTGHEVRLLDTYVGLKLDGETIEANNLGVQVAGTASVPTRFDATRSVVSGNATHGVYVDGTNSAGAGRVRVGNGSKFGTNVSGTEARANGENGLLIENLGAEGSQNTVVIGMGTENPPETPVVLSGNGANGLEINRSRAVRINNARIGVGADATTVLGNGNYGLSLDEATGVIVGDSTANELANVIGGNGSDGIWTYNIQDMDIRRNYIGTNPDGADLGNGRHGIYVDEGNSVQIKPPADGDSLIADNVISANAENGIMFQDLGQFTVQDNIIGLTPDEASALGNGKSGVCINGSDGNVIGGVEPAFLGERSSGNVIAANAEHGVNLMEGTQNTLLEGNFIGTNTDFAPGLGNGLNGINLLDESGSVQIGGLGLRQNILFNNGGDGVFLSNAGSGVADVSLNPNRYSNNGGLGINLEASNENEFGINTNDFGDFDTGTNTLRNHPNIRSVARVPGENNFDIVLTGDYFGVPETAFTLDFYYSNPTAFVPEQDREGENYLGSVQITTDAVGQATYEATFVAPSAATEASLYTVTAAAGIPLSRVASSEFGIFATARPGLALTSETSVVADGDTLTYQIELSNPSSVDVGDLEVSLTLDKRLTLSDFTCETCTLVPGPGNTSVLRVPFLAAGERVLVSLGTSFLNGSGETDDLLLSGSLLFGGETVTAEVKVAVETITGEASEDEPAPEPEVPAQVPVLIRTGGSGQ